MHIHVQATSYVIAAFLSPSRCQTSRLLSFHRSLQLFIGLLDLSRSTSCLASLTHGNGHPNPPLGSSTSNLSSLPSCWLFLSIASSRLDCMRYLADYPCRSLLFFYSTFAIAYGLVRISFTLIFSSARIVTTSLVQVHSQSGHIAGECGSEQGTSKEAMTCRIARIGSTNVPTPNFDKRKKVQSHKIVFEVKIK
jgi:hypothetical protein